MRSRGAISQNFPLRMQIGVDRTRPCRANESSLAQIAAGEFSVLGMTVSAYRLPRSHSIS